MWAAADVGNTRVAVGIFRGPRLAARLDAPTGNLAALERAFRAAVPGGLRGRFDAFVVASVHPPADRGLAAWVRRRLGLEVLFAGRDLKIPFPNRTRRPGAVGADRLLNSLAAWRLAGGPCIVVDTGTAVTFDVVKGGAYLGGAIAPGLCLAARALHEGAALLPLVRPAPPAGPLGRDTASALRSGIVLGAAGMVDRLVGDLSRALRFRPAILLTGGDAPLLSPLLRTAHRVVPNLTLEGLRMAVERHYGRDGLPPGRGTQSPWRPSKA